MPTPNQTDPVLLPLSTSDTAFSFPFPFISTRTQSSLPLLPHAAAHGARSHRHREGEGIGDGAEKGPEDAAARPRLRLVAPAHAAQDAEKKQPRAAAEKQPALSKRAGCGQQGIGPFRYEPDIWTEVAKHLHGTDLLRLSATCIWFRTLLFNDSIWRYAFLRDLSLHADDTKMLRLPQVPRSLHHSWRLLYAAAFDGTHAYYFRQPEKQIESFRIGGFLMDTSKLLLTAKLALPPMLDESPETSIGSTGACLLTNVRPGIWIADMNMVRCPACNLNKCEGTAQILDARHCELYLENNFRNGTWEYEDLGSYFSDGQLDTAAAAILNRDHIDTPCVKNILSAKSWIRDRSNLLPRAYLTPVAVALSSNLKPNGRLLSRFQAMRDTGTEGQIVSVRITQQLL